MSKRVPFTLGDLTDHQRGTDDVTADIPVGPGTPNVLCGDAGGSMFDHARGGNDTLTGNRISGDALFMFDHARGGKDTLIGASNSSSNGVVFNEVWGEAANMRNSAQGGNDTLIGGNNTGGGGALVSNGLVGDGANMFDSAQGGDDTLIGGNNTGGGQVLNGLFGDAFVFVDSAKGGNDTLYAGTAAPGSLVSNLMWGDGEFDSAQAQGGRDRFVFKDDGPMTVGISNRIEDFSQSQKDKIVFSGVEDVQSFNDLTITRIGTGTIITAGADQVTLDNFTNTLTEHDFVFV
ncbi:hypothetical protein [Mesorhizobium sp. M6A.T.Cr.TU.017.01.1.1]|uniref:hypothetical protein n=1 Tax=Mesorhizobium sp. M6A.T.Cr.TU.017.01.1.1 TaxID=2496774 RepID=UPI0013E2DFB6|nr:hypothetical protein [Mesorhizobium sp. M6A.T.Cr.TU.017.01.1.1]